MRKAILLAMFCLFCGCASFQAAVAPAPTFEYVPSPPARLAAKLPFQPNGEVDHFVVLIGGNTELRHRGNLSMAYQVLVEKGHEYEDIFVLDSEGPMPWYPWTDEATLLGVRLLFAKLALVMEEHDTLFVYMTGHGNSHPIEAYDQEGKRTNLNLNVFKLNPAEELLRGEFADMLNRINGAGLILVTDFCYWGVNPMIHCKWVQMSATTDGIVSHGTGFARTFWNHMRHNGSPQAAFDAAVKANPQDKPSLRVCGIEDDPGYTPEIPRNHI